MSSQYEMIPFHQHQIMTVRNDDGIFVVMKPIVEAMGLHWESQRQRMQRHPLLNEGTCIIQVPSTGGDQEAVTLHLEQFHGWLITLSPDRIVETEKRELIIRYQREAFRVVFEHFHGRIGQPRRPTQSIRTTISVQNHIMKLMQRLQIVRQPDERRAIHQMLDGMCQDIGIDTPALLQLGSDAPQEDGQLAEFWAAIESLQQRGHNVNMARGQKNLALYLPALDQMFRDEELGIRINPALRRALERSQDPQFIAAKSVNCRDAQVRHCWVFVQ